MYVQNHIYMDMNSIFMLNVLQINIRSGQIKYMYAHDYIYMDVNLTVMFFKLLIYTLP